jgi:hypothetical protein
MLEEIRLTRRACGLGLLGLLGSLLGMAPAAPRPAAVPRALLALVRRPESARVVGRAYLGRHPEEADAARLAALLERQLRERGAASLGERVARRVRQDFAEGATVHVKGWILSRTEARLCALQALARA